MDLFVDGERVTVPAGIGIDIAAAGVRDELTPDGTIHEESRTADHAPYTLGEFFTEWGVSLDADCVGEYCRPHALIHVFQNGMPYDGDPAGIPLESHLEIAIVIGQPPTLVPSTWDFGSNP